LLLDVSNLYANVRNHRWDAKAYLEKLPLERLAYVHIAGGISRNGLYHDTHAHAIPDGALDLLAEVCSRVDVPAVMLVRDDHFPDWSEVVAELEAIGEARRRGALK